MTLRKKSKIRNRYSQVSHLTQDNTLESVKNTRKHHIPDGQEVSPCKFERLAVVYFCHGRIHSTVCINTILDTVRTKMHNKRYASFFIEMIK